MAEFTTIFLPGDESFVPSDKAIQEAVDFLDGVYFGHYSIKPEKHSTPRLIDSGADFDRFSCPACKAIVTAYDHSDWWYLGPGRNLGDQNEIIEVPCCGAKLPFDQFDFGKHIGYAKFQINVEYAGENVAPDDQQVKQLESLLGCRMRRIIRVMD